MNHEKAIEMARHVLGEATTSEIIFQTDWPLLAQAVLKLSEENNNLAYECDRAKSERDKAENQLTQLHEAIRESIKTLSLVQSMCGNPDAAEGCRHIILVTRKWLERYGKEGG